MTALLVGALAAYAWRRRNLPGAPQFVVACLCSMMWVGGAMAASAAVDVPTQVWWYKFQVTWQLPSVTAILAFVLEYAWPGRWLTRRNVALLTVAPVIMALLVVTNEHHHLMWWSLTRGDVIVPERGVANLALLAYAMGLAFLQLATLGWLFWRSPQHRWPAAIMMGSVVFNRVAYLVVTAGMGGTGTPSPALTIAVSSVAFALAMFGFRILDPVAQAQRMAIGQMHDGLLVLDIWGTVISANPAAAELLGVAMHSVAGRDAADLLPQGPELAVALGELPSAQAEVSVELSSKERNLTVRATELRDWRDMTRGRLLLLRDVTGERRAQQQALQAQRSLATLVERERLARELHDSLGQTLAAVYLQANTARLLLQDGAMEQVDNAMEQLADIAHAAEVDIREYILGARTFAPPGLGFFAALQQYAARLRHDYGLAVELDVPGHLAAKGLDPAVETQLRRIIQEALSNVRKHARARSARVGFSQDDDLLQVVIADDGQGFDAAKALGESRGFGLVSMRERAESLGGQLEVVSKPGQGTRIILRLQLEELRT